MLTVTENAANALQALRVMSTCQGSGVRISKNESSRLDGAEAPPELRLDIVTETPADDEVVRAPGGGLVFIEPRAVSLVEDRVLDGSIDEAGQPAFFLKVG
jgi:Fe-S cluster assembly iron-binding protein IscA